MLNTRRSQIRNALSFGGQFTVKKLLVATYFVLALAAFSAVAKGKVDPQNFRNPGGKWMPQQVMDNAETLRDLGLKIDPKELSDQRAGVMGAIVSLDGCSGSFVSPEGLIFTNHHCVDAMLSYFSQQDLKNGGKTDYVREGFRADEREKERNVGPSRRVFVT